MLCGKALEVPGSICAPCQERVRKEALGEWESTRAESEKELRKHGVPPEKR
ncbi:MAG TPA: hypothetical protein VNL14_19800 [Candidatus Acidoferrales bacterium]|nr:hypothetical protein [Candidatus Acidoferrales bacterium]